MPCDHYLNLLEKLRSEAVLQLGLQLQWHLHWIPFALLLRCAFIFGHHARLFTQDNPGLYFITPWGFDFRAFDSAFSLRRKPAVVLRLLVTRVYRG